jgi:hypothetical protein
MKNSNANDKGINTGFPIKHKGAYTEVGHGGFVDDVKIPTFVLLTGAAGSGKSTISKRLRDGDDGLKEDLIIDGSPVREQTVPMKSSEEILYNLISSEKIVINLDQFGHINDQDKWIIDFPAVVEVITRLVPFQFAFVVFEGVSDNISDITEYFRIAVLYYLKADIEVFKEANRLKSAELEKADSTGDGSTKPFIPHFREMSSITEFDYNTLVDSQYEELRSIGDSAAIVHSTAKGRPTVGWTSLENNFSK